MPLSQQQRSEAVRQLRANLSFLSRADSLEFLRRDLQDLGFSEYEEPISYVAQAARSVEKLLSGREPLDLIVETIAAIEGLSQALSKCESWAPLAGNTTSRDIARERSDLVDRLESGLRTAIAALDGAYLRLFATNQRIGDSPPQALQARFDKMIADYSARIEEQLGAISLNNSALEAEVREAVYAQTEKLNEVIEAAREAAAAAGVSSQQSHFSAEAERHERTACFWLIATMIVAAVTLGGAVWNVVIAINEKDLLAPGWAVVATAKLVLFSLMTSATVWAGRIYKAARHNEIVNRHRSNALAAYKPLVEGTSDARLRDAVISLAAQSVFMPQDTGLSGGAREASPPSVIDVIRPTLAAPERGAH